MDKFIRISNNEIINSSVIVSIQRYLTTSSKYNQWHDAYNSLIQDVTKKYLDDHRGQLEEALADGMSEDEIVSDLYKRFTPIIRKNIESEYGREPEPFTHMYKIFLANNEERNITEEVFNDICKELSIDMSKTYDDEAMYPGDPGSDYNEDRYDPNYID